MPGEAIMRLMAQIGDISQVVYREPGEGDRDPEGARGWLSKKRGDLQSLWGESTDRKFTITLRSEKK